VNTVIREGDRLVGYNTDASGWSWGFRRALPQADLSRVVLFGAGGAGSAVGYAALELGVGELAIFDVDPSRAVMLAAALQANFPDRRVVPARDPKAALRSASGLIHATPVGMASAAGMPLDETLLRPAMWVSEIVHVPLETPLLKSAQRVGCATVDGGHMNVGQAIGAFKLFTGLEPEPARMEAHFRRLAS
jgi:shikimate dehydrogenase